MKKEEIRHDPIKDKIIDLIEAIKENKNSVLSSVLIITLLIGGYGYFQNINLIKNTESISLSGLAQNSFINGNNDEAIVKFERLIKNYPKSNGAVQASVFLISEAIKSKDIASLNKNLDEIKTNIDNVNDPVLEAYFYGIMGDIALNNYDYKEAISNYKVALKSCSNKVDMAKFQISISSVLLLQNKYKDAKDILDDVIIIEKLGFNEKNKAEELLAYIKQKMST